MAFEVIQMYGAVTGDTQNGLASIFIPQDGTIEGVDFAVSGDLDADGEFLYTELSFISTNQASVNDARGVIASTRQQLSAVTAASVVSSAINHYVPMDLPVQGGERVYMHTVSSTGVTGAVNVGLQFRSGAISRRALRRT